MKLVKIDRYWVNPNYVALITKNQDESTDPIQTMITLGAQMFSMYYPDRPCSSVWVDMPPDQVVALLAGEERQDEVD